MGGNADRTHLSIPARSMFFSGGKRSCVLRCWDRCRWWMFRQGRGRNPDTFIDASLNRQIKTSQRASQDRIRELPQPHTGPRSTPYNSSQPSELGLNFVTGVNQNRTVFLRQAGIPEQLETKPKTHPFGAAVRLQPILGVQYMQCYFGATCLRVEAPSDAFISTRRACSTGS